MGSPHLWHVTKVAAGVGGNQLLVASVCLGVFLLPLRSPVPRNPSGSALHPKPPTLSLIHVPFMS